MFRPIILAAALFIVVLLACGESSEVTPTPTVTLIPSPIPTPTFTPSPSPTPTFTPSPSPTPTATPSPSPTAERKIALSLTLIFIAGSSPVVVEEEDIEGPIVTFEFVRGKGFRSIEAKPVEIYEIVEEGKVSRNGTPHILKLVIERKTDGKKFILWNTESIPDGKVLSVIWLIPNELASVGPLEEGENGVSWGDQGVTQGTY